jgi:hypothetical protein
MAKCLLVFRERRIWTPQLRVAVLLISVMALGCRPSDPGKATRPNATPAPAAPSAERVDVSLVCDWEPGPDGQLELTATVANQTADSVFVNEFAFVVGGTAFSESGQPLPFIPVSPPKGPFNAATDARKIGPGTSERFRLPYINRRSVSKPDEAKYIQFRMWCSFGAAGESPKDFQVELRSNVLQMPCNGS